MAIQGGRIQKPNKKSLNAKGKGKGKGEGKDKSYIPKPKNPKPFSKGIENLIDLMVKVIRCDNRTEFKNRIMNQFCEMKGSGPNWIFDIDALTKSMNYKPVVIGNQSNSSACIKVCDNADSKSFPDDGFKPSKEEEKKDAEDPENKDCEVLSTEELRVYQEKDDNVSSTNNVNAASNTINTISLTFNVASIEVNVVDPKTSIELPNDPNMPELEDIVYLDDDEDVGAEADMNNLDTFMPMDVKSAFLYGKIEEEVYVCQPPGFEDPDFPDRVYKVEKALYGLHQAPRACSMGELTFFLGLQVKQKEDGIFISQDKYVTEILKKFGFSDVKTASTPMETHKPLLKDADGEDVDEHLYRSMIGSLMYLASSRPYIIGLYTKDDWNGMKKLLRMELGLKLVTVRVTTAEEVNAVYDTPSHTKKIFANMRRQGKDFSGTVTPLFSSMLAQQADMGEGSGQPTDPQHTSTSVQPSNEEPITVPSSSQPKKTHRPRKAKRATEILN
ncbi:putative ribonuclease H-like domain-containing protein [Tanacetum coccineum]